jgi:hypothetical protein
MSVEITIKEIEAMVDEIKEKATKESVYYEDLNWFSTNKYTVPSEYVGELLLFIRKIKNENDIIVSQNDLNRFERLLVSTLAEVNKG